VLIDEASTYLDGLGQMHGHFLQTDARGTVSQGEIYLDRPGKARFDYQPPASLIVVSDGHAVLVYDRRLKTFDRYPLGATPLALFLQRHVRLDEKVVVTRIDRFAGGFALTLRDGKRQAQGQVELTFGDAPMALRQWTITDAQGARTTIRISDLEPVASLDPGLFVLQNPNRR
jgi:outer membrane lipoprotein-sorting protein